MIEPTPKRTTKKTTSKKKTARSVLSSNSLTPWTSAKISWENDEGSETNAPIREIPLSMRFSNARRLMRILAGKVWFLRICWRINQICWRISNMLKDDGLKPILLIDIGDELYEVCKSKRKEDKSDNYDVIRKYRPIMCNQQDANSRMNMPWDYERSLPISNL